MQRAIPGIFMRGGTSRGLYLNKADLPDRGPVLDRFLLAAYGSPDPTQIDGVGGATSVTSKAAILSPSPRDDADIDYLFAQVGIDKPVVDYGPTCGNILAGVGPYAIETGMIAAEDGETRVRIHQVNTGGMVEAVIQTPGGHVLYEGDTRIDGVAGSAAPVLLNFSNVVGSRTGALFPTGKRREEIEGVPVTLVDASMPVMALAAADGGITGYEGAAELNADPDFFARLEPLRRIAGKRMGLGDVSAMVIPKIALVAPPRDGGHFASRYLVPDRAHATHAVTGGIAMAAAAVHPGTVVHDASAPVEGDRPTVVIEHPAGKLELVLTLRREGDEVELVAAGTVRTARLLLSGQVHVPESVFAD